MDKEKLAQEIISTHKDKGYSKILEEALDACIDMYCCQRELVLAYENKMPTEMSVIPRQYVKNMLLKGEKVEDKLVLGTAAPTQNSNNRFIYEKGFDDGLKASRELQKTLSECINEFDEIKQLLKENKE